MSEHVRRPTDQARQRMPVAVSARRRTHAGIRSALAAALAVAGLGGSAIAAPPADADETVADRIEAIDAFVAEQMRELHIPGLALSLIENGRIVYEHGYGVADTSGRAVTPHTPFILASTSKQFTGLAVQQLVRDGTIELDAPVSRYLPAFASADEAHRSITVRQLLGQTSGYSTRQGRETLALDGGPDDTLEVNARRLAAAKLSRDPGSSYQYSNANYDLLGYLVEEVTGVTYAQYLQAHVLDALGMQETYISKADAGEAGLADGFYPWFGIISLPTPAPYPRSDFPSIGVISSVHDLTQVVLAQLDEIPADQVDVGAELLAATRVPLSRENDAVEYASGWHVHRFWPLQTEGDPNNPALPLMYEHDGDASTYKSFLAFVPDLRFGMVMTANASDEVVSSPWRNFVFDTMRVANGVEPRMAGPTEDVVRQFARPLYVVAILLQLVTAVWSLRVRRRRLAIGLAALANAGALGLMLIYAPVSSDTPLAVLLRSTPDLGVMTVFSVLVASGWLALLLVRLVANRRGRMPACAVRSAAGPGTA
jgi:CubicO group peptidase (beta-lactamase class C family)